MQSTSKEQNNNSKVKYIEQLSRQWLLWYPCLPLDYQNWIFYGSTSSQNEKGCVREFSSGQYQILQNSRNSMHANAFVAICFFRN